jgi:hypothetical protein
LGADRGLPADLLADLEGLRVTAERGAEVQQMLERAVEETAVGDFHAAAGLLDGVLREWGSAHRDSEQVAALRGVTARKAAESDLRRRGKEAFASASGSTREREKHRPHGYWNPDETTKRDPTYLGR